MKSLENLEEKCFHIVKVTVFPVTSFHSFFQVHILISLIVSMVEMLFHLLDFLHLNSIG